MRASVESINPFKLICEADESEGDLNIVSPIVRKACDQFIKLLLKFLNRIVAQATDKPLFFTMQEDLPAGIRVGTVDKFQGQEAPVCLVSMAASSTEEIPRGIEFLFSLNRINVAVSRAKALAIVFGSPRLREARCETVDQMRLVNTICALKTLEVKLM